MKKTMLCCTAFFAALTCNAQVVQIIENGNLLYEHKISAETEVVFKEKPTPTDENTINGHGYVEIGGLKWATMNIGATTIAGDPATCYGDYFAWSEIEPRYTSKTYDATSKSWTFASWTSEHSLGYSYSDNPTYSGTTLDAQHDAAAAKWGGTWRSPNNEDFKALFEACGSTKNDVTPQTTSNATAENIAKGIYWCDDYKGVKGILFCDGTNKLFLPAAGFVNTQTFSTGGTLGRYWSSSLETSNNKYYAYNLRFNNSSASLLDIVYPYFGFTIRPVSD